MDEVTFAWRTQIDGVRHLTVGTPTGEHVVCGLTGEPEGLVASLPCNACLEALFAAERTAIPAAVTA